ncbi:hypothetical protein PM082_004294 [Marasmius tenuissimus]|nr:hypothetical protein PM082_004294 [Marasmius tenuissimus]
MCPSFLALLQLLLPKPRDTPPSPRCTASEVEHIIDIGDVGVCHDTDPFHTFFNITKDLGGISGVQPPDGVDPPCVIAGNDITVDPSFHERYRLLARPEIPPSEDITHEADNSRIFTLQVSANAGALLMLPCGGVLKKLHKTREFRERILLHWNEWYRFAEEEGEISGTQTLCLVTGVERCSTWAIAVWDATSADPSRTIPGFLELTVAESGDCCSWTSSPLRCATQSSTPRLPNVIDGELPRETVFIRGFSISRSDGTTRTNGPLTHEDSDRNFVTRRQRSRSPSDHSSDATYVFWNPLRWFFDFESSRDSSNRSRSRGIEAASSVPSSDENVADMSNIIKLKTSFDTVSHPCHSINMIALEIASRAQPSLFKDPGCVAVSHDEDWMSVFEDLDEPHIPERNQLLKHFCGRFKFVSKGDAIYTEQMTPADLDFIQLQRPASTDLTPVLFQVREPVVLPEHTPKGGLDTPNIPLKTHSKVKPGDGDVYHSDRITRSSVVDRHCQQADDRATHYDAVYFQSGYLDPFITNLARRTGEPEMTSTTLHTDNPQQQERVTQWSLFAQAFATPFAWVLAPSRFVGVTISNDTEILNMQF